MSNIDNVLKSRDITLPTKVHTLKTMVFSVFMYGCELDHKKGRTLKNWCFWAVLLEKNLESPLDSKKIKPVNPKGNQLWILIGRIDAEAEAPVLGHLMQRADSLERTLTLGKTEAGGEGKRGWDDITHSMDMNLDKLQETVRDREA